MSLGNVFVNQDFKEKGELPVRPRSSEQGFDMIYIFRNTEADSLDSTFSVHCYVYGVIIHILSVVTAAALYCILA